MTCNWAQSCASRKHFQQTLALTLSQGNERMKGAGLYTLVLQVRANYFTTNMRCGSTDELQRVCVCVCVCVQEEFNCPLI